MNTFINLRNVLTIAAAALICTTATARPKHRIAKRSNIVMTTTINSCSCTRSCTCKPTCKKHHCNKHHCKRGAKRKALK